MLRAAHRVTGNPQDAEDVLQSVFLRLMRREAPIELTSDAGSYLQRSAVNAALDLMRSRKPATVIPFEDAGRQAARDPHARAERSFTDEELRGWLRGQIAEMSPMAAEVFALRYFEDFGNQEIATYLGTSPNSVAVILHRTRCQLREAIQALSGDES